MTNKSNWREHKRRLADIAPTLAHALGHTAKVSVVIDPEQKNDYEGAFTILGRIGKLEILVYLGKYFKKSDNSLSLQFLGWRRGQKEE